jgi:hypothetical protein
VGGASFVGGGPLTDGSLDALLLSLEIGVGNEVLEELLVYPLACCRGEVSDELVVDGVVAVKLLCELREGGAVGCGVELRSPCGWACYFIVVDDDAPA